MRLIGLSGYARSGKDSAASVLIDRGWQRISFADTLRGMLERVNPQLATGIHLGDALAFHGGWEGVKVRSHDGSEARRLLQNLGQAARELFGEDCWVNAALRDLDPDGSYVVTDVRYKNEAQRVRDLGGRLIRVSRPGVGPAMGADGTVHVSETDLDDWPYWDWRLMNNSTLGGLRSEMISVATGPGARELDRV